MSNELRIEIIQDSNGEHVSLDNIPLDAAESLQIFIESLTKLAKTFPDSSDIKLKLENNSIDACLVYEEENKIITNEIDNLIENKSDSNVRIKIFKDIQERINLNGLEYKVILKNQGEEKDLTEKFKGKKFSLRRRKFNKQYAIKFIEGNLFEAGGKSTVNVHLDNITEGIEYKVSCTKPQAKKLNQRLYSKVFLSVIENKKAPNNIEYTYVDDYLKEEIFSEYKNLHSSLINDNSIEKYDLIYNHIIEILNNDEKNNEEIIKIIRLYNNKFIDKGILRTILMTLKPLLRFEEGLLPHYNDLADTMRSRSTTGKI